VSGEPGKGGKAEKLDGESNRGQVSPLTFLVAAMSARN